MTEIKINHAWDSSNITQTIREGMQYAFLSSDFSQACPFVFCKDFLHDTIYSFVNNIPIEIFKFKYNPTENPLDLSQTSLIIKLENPEEIENAIDFINKFEDKIKLSKSYFDCSNEENCFVIRGDKKWMIAPPLISLYALFLRIGCSHKKKDKLDKTILKVITESVRVTNKNDKDYLLNSIKGIDRILEYGYDLFVQNVSKKYNSIHGELSVFRKNYPKNIRLIRMHHDCGILAYSCGTSKTYFPGWYR